MAMGLFGGGYMSLEQRSIAERLFWAICRKIRRLVEQLEYTPEELAGLDKLLSDTYFCNFSLFQSMPDSWAIKQLFPVMPIHRLNETPTTIAVLGDITCDATARSINSSICAMSRRHRVAAPLRRFALLPRRVPDRRVSGNSRRPAQLVRRHEHGARRLDENGEVVLEAIVKGDTVSEVLQYVEFDPEMLLGEATDRRRNSGAGKAG